MAIIDLELSELTMIYEKFKQAEELLDRYYREVSEILNTLNMKVASKKNIDDNLEHIKKYLKKEREYIGACATMVKAVIDSFKAGDKISNLPEYSFHVDNVKPSSDVAAVFPSGAMHATPDPLADHFENINLKMTEEAEQVFMDSIDPSNVEEVESYLQYLQMCRTGLK